MTGVTHEETLQLVLYVWFVFLERGTAEYNWFVNVGTADEDDVGTEQLTILKMFAAAVFVVLVMFDGLTIAIGCCDP